MRVTVSGALAALSMLLSVLLCASFCSLPAEAQRPAAQTIASATTRTITFRYRPVKLARSVFLAGAFNGWSKSATPMQRQSDGKTWQVTLSLAPGVYQYKFVIDDSTWIPDPKAPHVDDGNGNVNSQLLLMPIDYALRPGKIGDGIITTSAVLHLPDRAYISRRDETHFAFLLRTRHNDVQDCTLVWQEEKIGEREKGKGKREQTGRTPEIHSAPMVRSDSDPLYDTWRGIAILPSGSRLRYDFLLHDGKRTLAYKLNRITSASEGTSKPSVANGFILDPTQYPTLHVPDWPHDAVFYQIFPERFANGDPTNDGPDVQPWGTKPTFDNRMGGDLAGVRQHLDYLRDLGVNALYFNPIFTARSNHGYDTTDYLKVDPRFGTNDLLADLVADCHMLGWHVILDGVFNHTGVDTAEFKSLREEGERSPYRNWYYVKRFPLEVRDGQQTYVGWFGSPWLPKLNLANPPTRQFMLGVAANWLQRARIDGWRLDAADEVTHDYWIDFRSKVRAANPDAYIVGEIWGDAHTWLQGDQFDSVMNYRWRGATLDFLRRTNSRRPASTARWPAFVTTIPMPPPR